MPDMNEPYAYIEERIAVMKQTAVNLRVEVVRLTERADTLELEAMAMVGALTNQRNADEESLKEKKAEFAEALEA